MSCQHQIAHNQRTVLMIGSDLRICEYDQNRRCTVERIIAASHHSRVHLRKFCDQFRFLHYHDHRRLFSHSGSRIGSGFQDRIQLFVCDLLRFIFADASAGFHCFQYFIVHDKILLWPIFIVFSDTYYSTDSCESQRQTHACSFYFFLNITVHSVPGNTLRDAQNLC